MKHDIKIGISVGDKYGMPNFTTEVTDPYKAFHDINKYIQKKYGEDIVITINEKTRKRRRSK